jgi:hypothetical protein
MISDQAEEMSALIIVTITPRYMQQRFSLEILKSHLMVMTRMTRKMMTKRMTRRMGHPTRMMTRMTMSQKMIMRR